MSWDGKGTLCWNCQKAVPNMDKTRGCSWSLHFIPVEGWDAERVDVCCPSRTQKYQESYIVKSCPEFLPDGRKE